MSDLRACLRLPIPEIFDAARCLDKAVSAHFTGRFDLAGELIRRSDMRAIRDWSESLWGPKSPYKQFRIVANAPRPTPKQERIPLRMPNTGEKKLLFERDGYHCRFCGIPVIRDTIRKRIQAVYPDAVQWKPGNVNQHAAFQAMWVQYDHLLPHARGGDNSLANVIVTCAPCNFGRADYLLEELGLADPRLREPIRSTWDGLERFR